jgi:hypothetical protein
MSKPKRLVTGIVMEPGAHIPGSITDGPLTEEIIADTYYAYAKTHASFSPQKGVRLVQMYLAPCDLMVSGSAVKRGSWIMEHYIEDDAMWEEIKNGGLNAYSVDGTESDA